MLVITLTNVPRSLRGDLTKWCQEIQSGVYVGNVNAKIRDELWQRIMENIGRGEATMVYNTNNELGYQFRTTRADKKVIDYDGIPLMMSLTQVPLGRKLGFSKAYRQHQAVLYGHRQHGKIKSLEKTFVVVDVETTGLDIENDQIMSIGAVKDEDGHQQELYRLVNNGQPIPEKISELTGINEELIVEHGVSLKGALSALREFIGNNVLISYNANFDRHFLQKACDKVEIPRLDNVFADLMRAVKKHDLFLDNYRLSTVLDHYQIKNQHPHNSLADAEAEYQLAMKLIKIGALIF